LTAYCVRTYGKKDLEVSDYPFEGKYVAIGPECRNKLFAYDVKGLARTYAAVSINCVETLYVKHLETVLLIVPLLNKIINVLKTIEKKATITFDSCLFNIISQALRILNIQYSVIGEHTLEVVYGSKEANIRINISFDYKEDIITDSVWNVSCLRNTSFNCNVAKYLDKTRLHGILTEISVDDIDNLGLKFLVKEMRRKLVVISF